MENWLSIPDQDGYEISSLGRVRSLERYVASVRYETGKKLVRERILRPFGDGHGYAVVKLNGQKKHKVHRLVALAFIGPCPQGQEVRHLDGDPQNNTVENLKYGTRAENIADAIRHGTFTRGQLNGTAKLTDASVATIKADLMAGAKGAELARLHGVSPQAICDIKYGRNWAHI